MDCPLEQGQKSGQVEARCVSYHMFKSDYYSKYVSYFYLSFLKSTRIYRLYSNTSKNCKVFGLYSCLKN
jgi:hypothetical protein